jgi:hypothetical protein
MMGWDWRLRTAAITGLLFIPRVNVSAESCWWWRRLGITPDLSTRARRQSCQQRHLGTGAGMVEGIRFLRVQYLSYVNRSFRCRKLLRHVTSGFTSHLKEGVLRIFIALKNPSCRLGLNPKPWGPAANTLTITPPRRLDNLLRDIAFVESYFR